MISGLRFHDLRHTFATRLRAKGVHEMDIMTLLGHTTLQMTSRYTHAMPQNLRTAVDSLNKKPLPFRPTASSAKIASRSRQVATGTDECDLMNEQQGVERIMLKAVAGRQGLEPR